MGARSSERQHTLAVASPGPPGSTVTSVRRSSRDLDAGVGECCVADRPTDVLIAGVNKAGTTSLFVSLSEHPRVAPSAVKETRFFLPARYGKTVPPEDVYDQYFTVLPDTRARLEATPSYFYGGGSLARVIDERLPG